MGLRSRSSVKRVDPKKPVLKAGPKKKPGIAKIKPNRPILIDRGATGGGTKRTSPKKPVLKPKNSGAKAKLRAKANKRRGRN